MAEPEPIDDAEPDAEPEEARPAPEGGKPRSSARPEWLVGAEEALESEFGQFGSGPGTAPPELHAATPPTDRPRPGPPPVNPYAGFAQSAAGRAFGTQWLETAYAGSSPSEHPASPAHAADHPPMPEVTAEPREEDAGIGDAPDPDDAAAPDHAATAAPDHAATAAPGKARRPAPPPPPPPRPWWEKAVAAATTPLGLIAIGTAVVLVIGAFSILGAKDPSVTISKLRRDPQKWDGQTVRVHGTVGEVYPVGGGYSFYLLQGRDTIVVFTRSRTPVRDERIAVKGVVSTGVLNGELRQALLENTQ